MRLYTVSINNATYNQYCSLYAIYMYTYVNNFSMISYIENTNYLHCKMNHDHNSLTVVRN